MSAQSASAGWWSNWWNKPKAPTSSTPRSVPELSATGSTAGLALIVGAAAIAFGRRRKPKS